MRPMQTVAALYVDRKGPYPSMPGVEIWDEARDATRYAGPHPVVAHPPCQRWCKLAKNVAWRFPNRPEMQVGADGGLFAAALAAVRRHGGVLEHPAWSLAWPRFGLLAPPRKGWARSLDGEWTCEVAQSAYGHECRKLTWLVLVGAEPPPDTRWDKPRGTRLLTHFAQRHSGDHNDTGRGHDARVSGKATHLTPPAFAEFLVSLARRVDRASLAGAHAIP